MKKRRDLIGDGMGGRKDDGWDFSLLDGGGGGEVKQEKSTGLRRVK